MYDYDALFAFLAAFSLIVLVVGLIYYIFSSLGLYKMASKSNLENAWLAWIPFGNAYTLGSIVGEITFLGKNITNLGLVVLLAPFALGIASFILGFIPFLGALANFALSILYLIFSILVVHKMFKLFVGESATVYTVVTFIVPFGLPICFMLAGGRERIVDPVSSLPPQPPSM